LYASPGSLGADIACGEGQSLGIPRSFGGPGLGIFATRTQYVRSMPGRLVGKTTDLEGRRGFVLTLSTREQHIRREKATSNICSNQGLCATAAAMYMACLGGTGFRNLARLNFDNANYLKNKLQKAGAAIPFSAPIFNEFVIRMPGGTSDPYQRLLDQKIIAGLPLGQFYTELDDHYLICATETCTKAEMDRLVKEVSS
jgi:glycine dehydrogenase subunit 1